MAESAKQMERRKSRMVSRGDDDVRVHVESTASEVGAIVRGTAETQQSLAGSSGLPNPPGGSQRLRRKSEWQNVYDSNKYASGTGVVASASTKRCRRPSNSREGEQQKGKQDKHSSDHATGLKGLVAKIAGAVNLLYKNAGDEDVNPAAAIAKGKDNIKLKKLNLRTSGNSSSSDSSAHQDEPLPDSDEEEDGYDIELAAKKVNGFLSSLKAEQRTVVMHDLCDWYNGKLADVEEQLDILTNFEDDFERREDETKDSLMDMNSSFEEKQMREVQVLRKCQETIHSNTPAAKLLQRHKLLDSSSSGSGSQDNESSDSAGSDKDSQDGDEEAHEEALDGESPIADPPQGVPKADPTHGAGRRTGPRFTQAGRKKEKKSNAAVVDEPAFRPGRATETDTPLLQDDGHRRKGKASARDSFNTSQKRGTGTMAPTHVAALDAEAARRQLKDLTDLPQKVCGSMREIEDVPASDLLELMHLLQEGASDLDAKADLARKNNAVLRAAVEHLSEDKNSQKRIANPAVSQVIEDLRSQIFGGSSEDDVVFGVDPEEIEEECSLLERIMSFHKKQIDDFGKQRRLGRFISGEAAANHDDDEGEDDVAKDEDADNGEEPDDQPKIQKSEIRNLKLEVAAQDSSNEKANSRRLALAGSEDAHRAVQAIAGGEDPRRALPAVTGKIVADTKDQAAASAKNEDANYQHESEDAQQLDFALEEKVLEMEAQIKEKTENIDELNVLFQRMNREHMVLKYCHDKSKMGIDSILDDFDVEASLTGPRETKEEPGRTQRKNRTVTFLPPGEQSAVITQQQAVEAAQKREEDAAALKIQIRENQSKNAMLSKTLKIEKTRVKALRTEVKDLRKEYSSACKGDKGAPSTLSGIDGQLEFYKDKEEQMRKQTRELQDELERQRKLVQEAEHARERAQRTRSDGRNSFTTRPSMQNISLQGFAQTNSLKAVPGQASQATYTFNGETRDVTDAVAEDGDEDSPHKSIRPPLKPSLTKESLRKARTGEGETIATFQSVAREDIIQLGTARARTMTLKNDIDDITERMQDLRKQMKKKKNASTIADLRSIAGVNDEEEEVSKGPPPELLQLRKEMRAKQNIVRNLRKQWWNDHKDVELIAAKLQTEGIEVGPRSSITETGVEDISLPKDEETPSWVSGLMQGGAFLSEGKRQPVQNQHQSRASIVGTRRRSSAAEIGGNRRGSMRRSVFVEENRSSPVGLDAGMVLVANNAPTANPRRKSVVFNQALLMGGAVHRKSQGPTAMFSLTGSKIAPNATDPQSRYESVRKSVSFATFSKQGLSAMSLGDGRDEGSDSDKEEDQEELLLASNSRGQRKSIFDLVSCGDSDGASSSDD